METSNFNNEKVTCCICLHETEKTNNFENWNCKHDENMCDNCYKVLERTNAKCPLCRSNFKFNIYEELAMIDLISLTQYNIMAINNVLENY